MEKKIKEQYTPPVATVVEIETLQMLAGSITGSAPDSEDSVFGETKQRRGEWGDLWK